eukprot:RCo043750
MTSAPAPALLLLLAVALWAEAGCHGFPGGGTSLQIASSASVAILPEFTGLANCMEFTMEFWYLALMEEPRAEGYAVEMVTRQNPELFSIATSEGAVQWGYARNFNLTEVPAVPGWHHIGLAVSPWEATLVVDATATVYPIRWGPSPPLPASVTLLLGKHVKNFGKNSV